jgi:membrane protein required for colicin V production
VGGSGRRRLLSHHADTRVFRSLISAGWVADIVGPIALFVTALVIFSLITGFLTSQIRSSHLSAVDRALGLGFGAARGALIACIAYIALNYFIPPEGRPAWIAQARTLPLLNMGAAELEAMVPPDLMKRGGKTAQDMLQKAQAAQKVDQDLNALTGPPDTTETKPAAPAQPTSPPAQVQRQQSAAPPAYTNKMSDQMDQAVQQALQGQDKQ